ncbi:xenotropic and polytropic retrovirus receptor 1 homolog [Drosophila novamexicana]|uniref:xenotropic and polytropic retrovirus receptor 1 homolog n=1 Tax=Drosophila novamexicana TaxID=47314 RepID=UPI0011E5EE99|nr:xenotropic and polytropic retrovirus receptor 1 homolog [Drosophila novamexicana]XP_030555500.1 xenotropic and polytropic retrovirus receptor 1 homolog [Drosophila novamexicana]
MKFGKTFESHLTSEWRQQYINYVELKAMIRTAVENAPDSRNKSVYEIYCLDFKDEFFTRLTAELKRVNEFFEYKMAEARRKHATFKVKLLYMTAHAGEKPAGVIPGLPPLADQPRNVRKLERAYSEFYFSLVLLNNFQQLNYTGFYRLSEKCDKYFKPPTGVRWIRTYLDTASLSLDGDELRGMIIDVENIYTQYIAQGDRAKAMQKLRVPPLGQSTSPGYVFSAGVLLGLFLVSAVVCVISAFTMVNNPEEFSTFTRLYRGPFSLMLYSFCLVGNVYVWQSVGINHVLIFELNPRNQTVPVKLLSTASFYSYICTLSMLMFIHYKEFGVKDSLYFPLIGLLLPLVLLVNPIPILNYPARIWILNCFGRILAAPFRYVTFADFWLADQMNSMVQCMVDFYQLIRFYIRYTFNTGNTFDFEPDFVVPVLRCLPAWFRLAQCLKRYWDSQAKPISYLVNAFTYGSTLIVVIISTVQMETSHKYAQLFENPWTWGYIISAFVSTIYCTSWDILQDYGLFRVWKGRNMFLRERLVYPKSFYYFAIIADISIRFFWLLELYLVSNNLVLPYNCKTLSSICEIARRFIWNFLRLENEHLYNCGNYRATRDIFVSALSSRDELLVNSLVDESRRNSLASRRELHLDNHTH